jgi:hypothetical protein
MAHTEPGGELPAPSGTDFEITGPHFPILSLSPDPKLLGVAWDGDPNITGRMINAVDAAPSCRWCQKPMRLARTIPEIGMLPAC